MSDLYWAYLQRAPDSGGLQFWVGILQQPPNTRESVRLAFATCGDFQTLVAGICATLGGTATVKYFFRDHQGSTRALMDGNGNVLARHDYLPFGEELWAGSGMRTTAQKFGAMDQTRVRYGLTEKDEATGLDHTWFRKYERSGGRWTSPDPIGGAVENPQTFNAYSYVSNDPVNLVDPEGLAPKRPGVYYPEGFWDSNNGADKGWSDVGDGFWGYGEDSGRRGRDWAIEDKPKSLWCPPGKICFLEPVGDNRYKLWSFGLPQDKKAIKEISNCQRFASRVQDLASAARNLHDFLDSMARTFLATGDGHPRDSSISEMRATDGGILVGEAATFVDNEGVRAQFIGTESAQIRHFVAAFIAASYPGGTAVMQAREPGDDPDSRADRAVNSLASSLFDRNAGHIGVIRQYLANDIRAAFCAN